MIRLSANSVLQSRVGDLLHRGPRVVLRDLHVRQAHQSQPLRELPGAAIGQYVTYRHKRQQPHYCNDDYHDDHTWIAEAFARNHQSGGDVAFPGTKRQCPSRISTRSPERPAHTESQCN